MILGAASGVGFKQVNVSADGVRTYDISGDWQWEESNVSMVPWYVADLIGIEDEGPTLHLTCDSGGTMSFTQDGNTFSGSATQGGECFTHGGQGPFYP